MLKGGGSVRTDWVNTDIIGHILASLTYENELACRLSLATGLRIGDCLALKTERLLKGNRFVVKEEKTGKGRRVYIPNKLYAELLKNAGRFYVFENRCDVKKHRTRQAVFKDIKRSADLFRVKENVAPHTMRKCFAVEFYKQNNSMKKVKELLNHSSEAITTIYAMADVITKKKHKR